MTTDDTIGVAFRLREPDLIAFVDHLLRNDPLRGQVRRLALLLAAVGAAIGALIYLLGDDVGMATIVIVGGLIMAAWTPRGQRKALRERTLKMYREGASADLLGTHRMTADHDWFRVETDLSRFECRWPAILRVDRTPHHLYLMRTDVTAFIVPLSGIEQGSFEAFADFCEEAFAAGREQIAHPPTAAG